MEVQKYKAEVLKLFKIGGFQIRSDVALIVVDKIKNLSNDERKEFLNKIFANIQNQNIVNNSIEEDNIRTAINVRV
jgi:hypothetical protein